MGNQIPEPPDGSRIEFEHHTDLYAAWRDDASSLAAGWTGGDGGEVWCLYGHSVPVTWAQMCADFGDSLRKVTLLVPVELGVAFGREQAAADALQKIAREVVGVDAKDVHPAEMLRFGAIRRALAEGA